MTTEEQQLVAELREEARCLAGEGIGDDLADKFTRAADTITRLVEERDRCHARLEIDHYWRIGDNDDADLERVEIPLDERSDFPDGIAARDATIALADEGRASLRVFCGSMMDIMDNAVPLEWSHDAFAAVSVA